MKLIFGKRFEADLKKLVRGKPDNEEKLKKCLKLLMVDIKHPSLRLHKLSGGNKYSISVDMKLRIILYIDGQLIYLLRIGNHEEVY